MSMVIRNDRLAVAKCLLMRGANPHRGFRTSGHTLLTKAAKRGSIATIQLLCAFGADPKEATRSGRTARSLAAKHNHHTLVTFLDAVAGWSAIRIAAGCRLHAEIRTALKLGRIDPADGTVANLVITASSPADGLWAGSLAVCPLTAVVVREAVRAWSPSRHLLFHPAVRTAVHTVLLAAERLRRRHTAVQALPSETRLLLAPLSTLPGLPSELWELLSSFLCRKDWPVLMHRLAA